MINQKMFEDSIKRVLTTVENDTLRIREIIEMLEDAYNEGYTDGREENESRTTREERYY
jgi:hypothetical protein